MKLTIKQYAEILDKAYAGVRGDEGRHTVIKDFAKMLFDDGKISRLPEILEHWKSLWNARHEIMDVEMTVADEHDARFPKEFSGKKVALKVLQNKAVLGGSILKIGDYLIDTSVRSKINAIRK